MAGTRIDLHVKVLDDDVVRRAKAAGLDGLVYAPHFVRLPEIRRRAVRFSDDEFVVVPAREIFTGSWRNRKHLLALDLDEPVPDFISLAGAMDELVRQDAVVLVPHPEFATVSLSAEDIRTYQEAIHAVETYNPKLLPRHTVRAQEIATAQGLPTFSSSYAHLRSTVGHAWTTFRDVDPEAGALMAALRAGEPRSAERHTGIGHRLRRVAEFAHLGYENSWEKFDRVVLSGMEATHPRHPAYDGRFDDVAVY